MNKINWALVGIMMLLGILVAIIINFIIRIFSRKMIAISEFDKNDFTHNSKDKLQSEEEKNAELTKKAEILLEQKLKELDENTTENGQ